MRLNKTKLIFCLLVLSIVLTQLKADDKVPTQFDRLSNRVLIIKTGEVYQDQVIALATKKGLVVIDTGVAPSLTTEYRKIIEREFGRKDFTYVINTHYHFDHTDGNQVFKDAEIIAHELSPDGMREFDKNRSNFIASRRARISQRENQLKGLDPSSTQAQRIRDLMYTSRIMCDDLEKNFVLTLPTITFKDRMTLDMGDLTLKLIYFGEGRHTGDDIIIHCPEEKLLFTGDLFFKGTMLISFRPQFDAQRWIEILDDVLKDMSKIKFVFDTHNGRMKGEFLALWHKYLVEVWKGLTAAKKEGLNYDAVQERFSYDKKFTYLEKSGVDPARLRRDHQTGLRMVWNKVLGLQSAATLLRQTISESGIKTAIEKYRKIRSETEEKYYFNEREFNTLGYQLMGSNQVKEAIEIFKLNVEAYPKSWNVYDSLGEAYMNDGQTKLAIKYYKKSLELNPQNTNAEAVLKRLENPSAQGTDD